MEVAKVAAGAVDLQPSCHTPAAVCSNFGRESMKVMLLEVLDYASNMHQQRVMWDMGSLLNGVEIVEGVQICCGDYRFVAVAPPTFCRNTAPLWQVWHEDRIMPL